MTGRKAYSISQLSEFATLEGLRKRTGLQEELWPYAVIKELFDNAADAAEEAGQAPVIRIAIGDDDVITIEDEGPGVDPDVVERICDYDKQTSSRAVHIVVSRGAQGNALQTIIAAPFVLSGGKPAVTVIESMGARHEITFATDPIGLVPTVAHSTSSSSVTTGTRVTVRWPVSLRDEARSLRGFANRFVWLNPHLRLSIDGREINETDTRWRKWPARKLTAHWYGDESFRRLLAAQAAEALESGRISPAIGETIRRFDGLSSTAKARDIVEALGLRGVTVEKLLRAKDSVQLISHLLATMKASSPKPTPDRVGCLGRGHLKLCMDWWEADEKFEYRRAAVEAGDGLPYVIETGFGYLGGDAPLHTVVGLNFSPVPYGLDPFTPSLDRILGQLHVLDDDPVVVFLHIASPRFGFVDYGKTTVALPPSVSAALSDLVEKVTAKWTRQKRSEYRDERARLRREEKFRHKDRPMSLVEAVRFVEPGEDKDVMTRAYRQAEGRPGLPVQPRQMFYKARPMLMRLTGRASVDGEDFGQRLLVAYMNEFPERTANWNITWKERGNFYEPHTEKRVGLGTLEVRDYVGSFSNPTIRPAHVAAPKVVTRGALDRYNGVVAIEKEGFMPLVSNQEIMERHDVAFLSDEGMSTTAGRTLVDEVCGRLGRPLFTLHDFDVSGFSIQHMLSNTNRRFSFKHEIKNVVDFGLRLADVEAMGLDFEEVHLFSRIDWTKLGDEKRAKLLAALKARLKARGATEAEIAFLTTDGNGASGPTGKRVELNAMSSEQLVDFIERKLAAHELGKVVPDALTLANIYQTFRRGVEATKVFSTELARINTLSFAAPGDLEAKIRAALEDNPALSWDEALAGIVAGETPETPGDDETRAS